jgi:hypothetical protein
MKVIAMAKILILSANPTDTASLRLDAEVREIQNGLERSRYRDQFEVVIQPALRVEDLRHSLLTQKPEIVHFSGHGLGTDGLALENATGQMQLVSTESLGELFGVLRDAIACVVLNACYTEAQIGAIHQHIDTVVGMNQAIGDRAAIEFARGFYDALGAGLSYAEAYHVGCTTLKFEGIPEALTPVLKTRKQAPPPAGLKPATPLSSMEEVAETNTARVTMVGGDNSNQFNVFNNEGGTVNFR